MSANIFNSAMQNVIEDIRTSYSAGDKYRSIREISLTFDVSLQTAQKVVVKLTEDGVLETRKRSGTFVLDSSKVLSVTGRNLLVVSNNVDPRFDDAFIDGIKAVLGCLNMKIILKIPGDDNYNTIQFGEKLISWKEEYKAIGIIALAFRNADLAFYHCMNRGCLLVSDVCSDSLPILPALQTNNHLHSREAAEYFIKNNKQEILITGYWKEGHVRQREFEATYRKLNPYGNVRYLNLGEQTSPGELYIFFHKFDSGKAVFSTDYAANYTVAPYFLTYSINPKNSFLVYDSENDYFRFPGLNPIKSVAPSLSKIGAKLAEKLYQRVTTGTWGEPLLERV